jgi:hypothetical protein
MNRLTDFRFFFFLVTTLLIGGTTGFSQTNYVLSASPLFKVEGGSSLHDWEMISEAGKGEGVFILENGKFKTVKA